MTNQGHERYSRREPILAGSDRSFGMVMAAVFTLLTLINLWHFGRAWPWTGALATLFLVFAWIRPGVLRPLNWIWFKFGLLLHNVVNPIVMALIFFSTVMPIGLAMRAMRKDPLRLKRYSDAKSYWIERRPTGPAPASMKDQF
jgi:hypothetical protein